MLINTIHHGRDLGQNVFIIFCFYLVFVFVSLKHFQNGKIQREFVISNVLNKEIFFIEK